MLDWLRPRRLLMLGPKTHAGRFTGLSLAFDLALEGMQERGVALVSVNSTPFGQQLRSGGFSVKRVVELFWVLAQTSAPIAAM